MKLFRRVLLGMTLGALASGCVYRINIQQGNFLDQAAVDQVKPGMTRSQIRYLLGTPMVADPFAKDRWDYIYYLKRTSWNSNRCQRYNHRRDGRSSLARR